MSSVKNRIFRLRKTADLEVLSDPIISFKYKAEYPFVAIESQHITNITLKEESATVVAPNNVIYDPDLENRFVFILSHISTITSIGFSIYYDTKYNDILITPNMDTFNPGYYPNNKINVFGYRLGTTYSTQQFGAAISQTPTDKKFYLPSLTGSLLTFTVHKLNGYGIPNLMVTNIKENDTDIDVYKHVNIVTFIGISLQTLFETEKVPMTQLACPDINKNELIPIGKQTVSIAYIPILF